MSNATNAPDTSDASKMTAGSMLDSAITAVATTASELATDAVNLVSGSTGVAGVTQDSPLGPVAMASATNSTGPTWIDSTFRTADATLLIFGILGSIFVILAFRGDHLTVPTMKMSTDRLLYVFVFIEAVFISNLWAYAFKLIPCVFTECLVDAEEPGSAAGVASILYIVVWSVGFLLLIGLKLAGLRGISIFQTDSDELTGMFGTL